MIRILIASMSAIFVFSLFIGTASAGKRIHSCYEQNFGTPNTCHCEFEENSVDGFLLLPCDRVACEQFKQSARPRECAYGMRAVTCFVTHFSGHYCGVFFPRVHRKIDSTWLCETAIDDVNENGFSSKYYGRFPARECRPDGYDRVPEMGWELKDIQDGLN